MVRGVVFLASSHILLMCGFSRFLESFANVAALVGHVQNPDVYCGGWGSVDEVLEDVAVEDVL